MNFSSISGQLGSFYSEDPSGEIKNGIYYKTLNGIYNYYYYAFVLFY